MKNIRRSSAAVATIATLALALTACSSGGNDDDKPSAEGTGDAAGATIDEAHSQGAMADFTVGTTFKATEPVDFTLMYRDHPNYPVSDDWSILKHLKDEHNVTFTRTDVPLADWDNKKSLLIGSGDFPEIVPVSYAGQETQFVASRALLPISDYFEYMPNFQQKVEDWGIQDELDTHKQEDGKIYILPGLREVPDVQYSVLINEDMWEKAGITEDPATWDEFAEDLKAVKEANPEIKYAFSDRWNQTPSPLGALLQMLAPNFKTEAGWDQTAMTFDFDAEEFVVAGTSDNYKEMVTYLAGLVADGTLDPEITQTDDQAIQKFITGQSATISGNTQYSTDIGAKLADAGKADLRMRLLTLPAGPKGDNLRGSKLTSGIMFSADAKDQPHFKALLQYVDWLYFSDEGIEFAQWGVEGETYEKAADGTRSLLAGIDWNGINPNAGDSPKMLNTDFGYSNGVFMLANGSTKELVQSVMPEGTRDWVNSVLDRKTLLPVKPSANMNEAELEQAALLETQVKDAVNTATAEFITGKKPLSDWDAYVKQIDGLGGTQLLDLYNTAYQRSQG